MKITEIEIKNFGKLHQISIRPLAGINIIYGENESGKSTLHQFLTSMLFGLEKQRGRSGRNDIYQQYEPWNSSSFYAGGLRFEVGKKPFFLQRNFYHKEKSALLISEQDQEELSVFHGDLEILLGGIKKDTFENTFCIGQAAIETKKEFASILQNYFLNASFTGGSGIDLDGAKKKLKGRQKEVELACKKRTEERREVQEKLQLEEQLLNRDISQLKEQIGRGEYVSAPLMQEQPEEQLLPEFEKNQMAEYLRAEREQKKEGKHKLRSYLSMALAAVFLAGSVWQLTTQGIVPGILCAAVAFVGTAGAVYWRNQEIHAKNLCTVYEKEWKEAKDSAIQQKKNLREQREKESLAKQKAVDSMLETQLAEKKAKLMNLEEELEEYWQPTEQEIELQQQVQAYQLSLDTLKDLSENIYADIRLELEEAVSEIIAGITGGKYTKMVLDDQMNLRAVEGNRMLYTWQLSNGTMVQMYIALRLGAGRVFSKEEPMPLLLDEVFASFDDVRLERMLQWLARQPEQIFLFTCQRREMEILEENGLPYGKIILKNT